MNYGELRTKFIARMRRRDMDTTLADGFLQDAITRIQRVVRVPAMEKSIQVTITPETYPNGRLAIPSDYLKLKDITVNGRHKLAKRELDWVINGSSAVGTPNSYARQGGAWVLSPRPFDQFTDDAGNVRSTVIRVDYWAEFPSASLPTDDTILIDIASDAVLFGALSYACDHWNDARGDKFEARFTQIISDIQSQADDDETSGGAVVAPAYTIPHEEED